MSSRLRRIGEFVVISLALALLAASSAAAALPGGYTSTAVDEPAPADAGDRFGESIVNAGDVNGDGRDDLLVGAPHVPGGLPGLTGRVVFVDGASGGIIRTVPVPFPQVSHAGADTDFGADVATLGDVNGDGVPEHLVSAPGTDLSSSAVDMGVVYVLDGASFGVLKQVQLAADDRPSGAPNFGASLAGGSGQPACAGHGGIASCPYAGSSPVAVGDIDGNGEPDFLVGAPDYAETGETNFQGCDVSCPGLGRVYVYSGEAITGSAAQPLDTPAFTIQWFDSATAAEEPHLGSSITPLGDVGQCDVPPGGSTGPDCLSATAGSTPTGVPDGHPDYLLSAPGLTAGGAAGAGKAFVLDAVRGIVIAAVTSPDPQTDAGFASRLARSTTAPGNLGGSDVPDVFVGATSQEVAGRTGQGRAYAFAGDVTAPSPAAPIDDPAAAAGARFGTFAGLGDIAGGDGLSELAIGRGGGGPVRIFTACGMRAVQTIDDQDPGGEFGAAIAPLGDLNRDGYLDLGVGAPAHDGGKGRVYLMKSNTTPGPAVDGCAPSGGGAGGGGGGGTGAGTGGGGAGGGVTTVKPPSGGGNVSTLAKRKLRFIASRKTLKLGKTLRLRGALAVSKRKKSCQRKQKVAIQRKAGSFWVTIDVAVTGRRGKFRVKTIPAPATVFYYRARVNQTRRCTAAISKALRVRIHP